MTESKIRNRLLSEQQVLCLAGNHNWIPMWSYYGESQGVAIHLRNDAWPIAGAMKVEYADDYPTLTLDQLGDAEALNRALLLRKSKAWIGEDEYRVVAVDADPSRMNMEWADNRTAVLGIGAVIGVTVGGLMEDGALRDVCAYARVADPPIPVFKAMPMRKEFKLAFVPIQ